MPTIFAQVPNRQTRNAATHGRIASVRKNGRSAATSSPQMVDRCRLYAQERIQFDEQPIGRFQRVQDVILDMDMALEQGLTWLLHLVRQYNAGTLSRESAAKVKIECSRRASELYIPAMEMCGGIAGMDEFGLMRHAQDLFVCRVGEGSNFALKTLAVKPLLSSIANLLQ
jgi:alkylation response protein AidB-like acyl-CoA dehydrogenase